MEAYSDPAAQLAEMKEALAKLEQAEQKCREQLERLRQRYADDLFAERQLVRQLREDRHRIQQDYERLRVQKGGFGLKMLLFSGFSGFVSALLLCALYWWLLRPAPDYAADMKNFRDTYQFTWEQAASMGHFEEVEQALEKQIQDPKNQHIRPSLEFTRKLLTAARLGCPHRR
ncbi:MAG: hypothetical protein NZM43_06095 [Saprospiraceae bacterium]|nr:hypothetical protein [Saprospiraceae bacterium]MDW8483881.1 hypothetical protein [Saprospiraceae bacterium]